MRAPSRAWCIAAGSAGLGLLVGHRLDYLLVPAGDRSHVLTSTGHGYLSSALVAAALGAIVTGLIVAAGGYARGRAGREDNAPRLATLIRGLVGLQVGGFLAIEILERAASGSWTHHLSARVLLAGLAIQAIIGLLAAWSIARLRRLAHAFGRAAHRTRPSARPFPMPRSVSHIRSAHALALAAPRAPPR